MTRYIFVVGGVMSGIGKGIATASIASLLENRGYNVTAVKIDPYINVDAGTMNPIEHGEVFVTEDGLESDQDLGNYERFLNKNIYRTNYMTTGLVYKTVIEAERALKYDGKCVEVVPHIPEEVIRRIKLAAKKSKADFVLVEIGGTVGEYQNILYLEAARMMKIENPNAVIFVLVSYLPVPGNLGEMKTKPTQYAVRTLNSAGLQPDIIIARSSASLDEPRKKKLSIFCNIPAENIVSAPDVKSIYEVPINFEREQLTLRILKKFGLQAKRNGHTPWSKLIQKIARAKKEVKIGIVGKYFDTGKFTLSDSYISVIEAIKHASWAEGAIPKIDWLNAKDFETKPNAVKSLSGYDGIIVPGGFGSRGVEGKIKAIKYAREHKIPYFGLCYGMQLATVEFARDVAGMKNANSTEINPKTPYPIIDILPEQIKNLSEKNLGGSMRLGAYKCRLVKNTIALKAYGKPLISERHRHRYEVNNKLRDKLEKSGLIFSGLNPEKNLVEIIELKNHPFFVGVQFHPELKSRPFDPHPLFLEFIKAALRKK
ncbi:MAG: CTP synthase [Candidatus Liptonbacteria bacterium]|nr:CTP synthase [Candidatus Liptonbacteria bacterium]